MAIVIVGAIATIVGLIGGAVFLVPIGMIGYIGYQAVLMAPTEVLARQDALTLKRLLAGSRVRSVLLSGQAGRRQRQENLAAIEAGEGNLEGEEPPERADRFFRVPKILD